MHLGYKWVLVFLFLKGEFDLIWGIFCKKLFLFLCRLCPKREEIFICPWFWIPFFIKTSVGSCCWLKCELCYSSNFSFQMIIKISYILHHRSQNLWNHLQEITLSRGSFQIVPRPHLNFLLIFFWFCWILFHKIIQYSILLNLLHCKF